MEKQFLKRRQLPPLSDPIEQQRFVQNTDTNKELLQKELSVNQAEQNLLQKRMQMMREFLNELPASDPQYNILAAQIQMDQIELDELKRRRAAIGKQLIK